ncbi:hypothetical protein BDK88_1689 [Natrinema hispanicum]|uniref:Uncharacterized protein n=1 Tax=Natrinema hispanicum TaxID=392421 RepID=A0A482YD13_9EURY|nr:hypothetical protein BDK88_1689 [Natrinema hispanicum]
MYNALSKIATNVTIQDQCKFVMFSLKPGTGYSLKSALDEDCNWIDFGSIKEVMV